MSSATTASAYTWDCLGTRTLQYQMLLEKEEKIQPNEFLSEDLFCFVILHEKKMRMNSVYLAVGQDNH